MAPRPHAVERGLERRVWLVLSSLVALDLTIAPIALFWPELWFRVFHDIAYVDPLALAPRMGANWAAFLILQLGALVRWRRDPRWLLLVVGVRLSDVFTDLTCLIACANVTTFGRVALALAGPGNLLAAWLLWSSHSRLTRST